MENKETIRDWAISVFGKQAHPKSIAIRALEELIELLKAIDNESTQRIHEEIADVEICMAYLAAVVGCNIQNEIENKMAINRQREWVCDGNGNGYHKKTSAELGQ